MKSRINRFTILLGASAIFMLALVAPAKTTSTPTTATLNVSPVKTQSVMSVGVSVANNELSGLSNSVLSMGTQSLDLVQTLTEPKVEENIPEYLACVNACVGRFGCCLEQCAVICLIVLPN